MSTYPTVRPSLTLDFQKSKQLDPRISFSRASTATYVEGGVIKTADEHQARFEDDGLLIEESRTNYAENSEDFSLWTAQNSTLLTAQGTAPNGTNTAFKIQENTSTISHSIREPTNSTWSGAATMSCYVKPAGRNFAYMGFTGVSQTSVTFDLVNKVSSYKGNNVTSGSVEDAGNGWLRIVAVFSSSITSGRATVGPAESDSLSGLNYTGDGSSGILAWGAQLEVGSFPTSYIPTTGSTVTRAADIAQITGDNFSSWYNQSEGTVMSTFKSPVPEANTRYWLLISNGANSTADGYRFEMKRIIAATSTGSNAWSSTGDWLSPTGYTQNAENRTAFGYDRINNYNSFSNNGAIQDTNTSATDVTVAPTTLTIGATTAYNDFSGHISRIAYYSERLTNEQLEAITS